MIWPTAEQERVLRLVLSPSHAALEAAGRVDVRRLDHTSRRLLPLAYPALRDLGASGPLVEAAECEYRFTASRNAALFERGRRLVQGLRRAGVEPIALKGAALVARYYRDAGLRPMADLDLLVPLNGLFPALAAFQRGGWTPRYTLTPSLFRTRHAAPFTTAEGFACDLHWRVFPEPTPPSVAAALWTAATEVDFHGATIRVLSPADQLLHVCLHGARWAPEPAVWWIGDAATIVRAGGVDWDRIVAHAVTGRFVLRLRGALGYLRDRMEAEIPGAVLERLRALPVAGLERLEWRLIAREHRVLGELPAYWCHHRRSAEGAGLRGLLGFPGYLKDAWGVRSAADLPRAATRRAIVRAASALGRWRARA